MLSYADAASYLALVVTKRPHRPLGSTSPTHTVGCCVQLDPLTRMHACTAPRMPFLLLLSDLCLFVAFVCMCVCVHASGGVGVGVASLALLCEALLCAVVQTHRQEP